jgi:hypothetical protein
MILYPEPTAIIRNNGLKAVVFEEKRLIKLLTLHKINRAVRSGDGKIDLIEFFKSLHYSIFDAISSA